MVETVRGAIAPEALGRVPIGHSGDSADLGYLTELAGSLPAARLPVVAPNRRHLHLTRDGLREPGVSEADITTMLVDNPRRFLSWRYPGAS